MKSSVPIFPQLSAGSVARDYLSLARQFQNAAATLSATYVNGQINWPSYCLLFHACELTLKAYCLLEIAAQHGLPLDASIVEALDELDEMHADHWSRYPDNRRGPIRDVSALASNTVEALIGVVAASV